MPKIELTYEVKSKLNGKIAYAYNTLPIAQYDNIDAGVLGVGNIAEEGRYIQCLAAFFDLEGFTAFSIQPESHLVVPEFLARYLKWLFTEVRSKFEHSRDKNDVYIWGSLPMYAKFMGDGVMLLWNTDEAVGKVGLSNVIHQLGVVRRNYTTDFLPVIKSHVTNPPIRLRCGIARGQVISIGGGADYVGPCINIANRLQKLSTLPFAVSRRGIDLSDHPLGESMVIKKVNIRSVGSEELVYVFKNHLSELPPDERKLFNDP